ncbi:ubiquinone biosynthesis regulatory protein kinase UbiB [Candidatus Endobugula sertula]|uniref:Ubiquinone biosynthesis regulatory protein kinase UbiB n=1 Tax=Candidatus Endobugula sertula TaxID=62101 RepID=A0A1D2QQX7_9GAMM|nr:ubiquinone biosynthesis regulatory protein kinase UbiB [Candidatus Endobugula sertula]
MTVLLRSLHILWVCCRYRLDQLVSQPLPMPLRYVLMLFPVGTASRGERLRQACETLGPIFVKFGQLLSTRPDLIPPDIVKELDQLQDNVPPFSPQTFREIVKSSLGQSLEAVFDTLEEQPLASASVAQVHAATLKPTLKEQTRREVVVKVIRPGIENTIQKDIALLRWVARCLERWLPDGKRLRSVDIVEDYRNTIFDELNLQREAANASQLRRNFNHSALLYVPEIIWEHSNKTILVMERIYGIPVASVEALEAQQTNMKLLAERGVEIFFTQVFEHNFFHADMHPGNIFVSTQTPHQPQYICIDMAIVGSLSREDQYYLARNLLAMFRRDYRQVAELHVQSGWVPKHTHVSDFEASVRTVCEPIFQKPLAEISFGKVMITLFQTAQRFNMEVQPQLILLQKTLLNIEGLGRQLYPELDLWQTAHPFLERWLENRLHPKTLFKEIKRYTPEWMEKLPDVPTTLISNMETLEKMGGLIPQIQQAAEDYHQIKQRNKRRYRMSLIATILAMGAAVTAWPQGITYISSLPPATTILGVAALGIWLFK